MKLPQIKWTQKSCIMCALVIIAIFLTMYLFRHYTLIEGFDFSIPDTSKITSSVSSLSSSLPSFSSSDWGPIGPLPKDNVVLPETIEKLNQIYADNQLPRGYFNPPSASSLVTEAEAQDFIKNLKWTWSNTMLTCMKDFAKQNAIDQATKAGKPPPTDEEIAKLTSNVDELLKSSPARSVVPMLIKLNIPCLKELKETIFRRQITYPSLRSEEGLKQAYKLADNKYLTCGNGGQPVTAAWNSTISAAETTPTTFSEFPTLVKGFQFITPVADFNICNSVTSAYSLDGTVSPFYQSFWGVPAGSSSSSTDSTSESVSSSSSDDPTVVLKQIKTQLNNMSLN